MGHVINRFCFEMPEIVNMFSHFYSADELLPWLQ